MDDPKKLDKLESSENLPSLEDVDTAVQNIETSISRIKEAIRKTREDEKPDRLTSLRELEAKALEHQEKVKNYLAPVLNSKSPKYKSSRESSESALSAFRECVETDLQDAINIEIAVQNLELSISKIKKAKKHPGLKAKAEEYAKTVKKYFDSTLDPKSPGYAAAQKCAEKTLTAFREVIDDFDKKLSSLGLTAKEEKRLASYTSKYSQEKHSHDTFNRTFEKRLEDHEILLGDIFEPTKTTKLKQEIGILHDVLFPTANHKAVFIDIGPGIANKDLAVKNGKGKPAITLQEMADKFPEMPCFALDLPDEMDVFTGKISAKEAGYKIDPNKREELLAKKNIHLVKGDGLKSLKEQLDDPDTNPYSERPRPEINENTTLIIRAANSIDVYCDWEDIENALKLIAVDFKDKPVLVFFNKEILLKPEEETSWKIIGQVSDRGFNHKNRNLSRNGHPPYKLDKQAITSLNKPIAAPEKIPEKASENFTEILNTLDYRNIKKLDVSKVEFYLLSLKQAADGGELTIQDVIKKVIPEKEYSLGLFYSNNYINGKLSAKVGTFGDRKNAFTDYYRKLLECSVRAKTDEEKHQKVLGEFAKVFGENIDWKQKAYMFSNSSIGNIPAENILHENHPDALDVFFSVKNVEGKQIGPSIHSVSAGIVIASASDWNGGKTENSYKGGGLSPKAGNGIVIYNPIEGKYYYYAHLYNVIVEKGDFIKAGQVIGKGGDTGQLAMNKGRGKHVHFEIHENTPGNKPLDSYELRALIVEQKGRYYAQK
ncbi:M23 family metallopeptidase [Patescibacteria group bacterium]|nr:M23 family metallopeptidase [Patescibacteria group bacterium]